MIGHWYTSHAQNLFWNDLVPNDNKKKQIQSILKLQQRLRKMLHRAAWKTVTEIAGEGAVRKGQILTGSGGFGSRNEGISIRYSGDKSPPKGKRAGTITFTQNSFAYK